MNVTVYSTPTCPYCNMVKNFLKENGIVYENIDVSSDKEAAQKMIDKSGQMGVPVIDVDGEIVTGFNKKKLTELLKVDI